MKSKTGGIAAEDVLDQLQPTPALYAVESELTLIPVVLARALKPSSEREEGKARDERATGLSRAGRACA